MHAKTMEGLVGAKTSVNMLETPFRVFKEARRRGDTATMERSMEYVGDFSDRAEEYKKKADEGMKEEVKEVEEKAGRERENAIRRRKEEREELEKRVEDIRRKNDTEKKVDTAEISEDGKVLMKSGDAQEEYKAFRQGPDITLLEPVIYTKSAETAKTEESAGFEVSV